MIAPKRMLALPGPLPAGETTWWRGRPEWRGLALRAFHVRAVAIYFGLVAVWHVASDLTAGDAFGAVLVSMLWLLMPCVAACAVLALLAWRSCRTTQYTITSQRIIMQFGIALPITLNIPFNTIGAAGLRTYPDGSGDITLTMVGKDRVAYLMLWPHVRPWRATRTEPMLRGIADPRRVSELLAGAVVGAANASGTAAPLLVNHATTTADAMPAHQAPAAA